MCDGHARIQPAFKDCSTACSTQERATRVDQRPLATVAKLAAVQLPIEFIAVIATTETRTAMQAYSIEVAPEVSRAMIKSIATLAIVVRSNHASGGIEKNERCNSKPSDGGEVLQERVHVC